MPVLDEKKYGYDKAGYKKYYKALKKKRKRKNKNSYAYGDDHNVGGSV